MRAAKRRTLVLAAVIAIAVATLLPARSITQPTSRRVVIQLLEEAPKPLPNVAGVAQRAITPSKHSTNREKVKVQPSASVIEERVPDVGIRVLDQDTFGDPPPPPADGPCAKAPTCPSYELRPARWKTDETGVATIKWRFNDEGRRNLRSPAGLLESAVRSSMAQWTRWNSNIVFSYDGLTTAPFGATGKDGSCADGTNVVTWDRYDPAVIAQAGLCLDRTGRIIRDADLAMNVTYHWEDIAGEPESRHSFDIRSIVTHELGHWLGLLDLYSSNDTKQTMSGFSEYGETSKRTPALGDILAVQEAYPCGEGDACPRKGIVDD